MARLSGKTAIVTGAGQGVGQGIAFSLAAEGARVVVSGRTVEKLEQTVSESETRGGTALPVACDVRVEDDLIGAINKAVSEFGALDILVNNAQMVPLGKLLRVSDEAIDDGWTSGPLAAIRSMRAAYPYLKDTKGSIVNLASSAAFRWDAAGYGVYGAVKEGIRQVTRAAACEWGKHGIRANCIVPLALSPGMQMWTEHNPEEAAAFVRTVPLGYAGDCEKDIGQTVAWLVSDEARYVTGQTIGLDGGQARIGG